MRNLAVLALVSCAAVADAADQLTVPTGDGLTVELFSAEPDIVTPVGMTIDARGRLLVVESHTHFRPRDYKGPPTDRIRIVEDTDGDGRADRFTTFWEGSTATMNLATHPDGSVYAAARNELFRLRDTNGDGVADDKHVLVRLETKGDYPHNGLTGLTIGPEGKVWFGIGENLGEPYKMIAAGGETFEDKSFNGGLIFHCDADGGGLTLHARGFWNPYGLCFDGEGNLFATDNDPDGRPPCRLIHVVPGGDYGYQYRYGRAGQHPLTAWEGELPGTLPPICGTGEAPCAILPLGDGRLLVASWGDHRVEEYHLAERGASFTATMRPVITGGHDFRPVGMAFAPDGSLYISDWVLYNYDLHGKGRLWRVRGLQPRAVPKIPKAPPLVAMGLRGGAGPAALLKPLGDSDPFVAQAAVHALSLRSDFHTLDWASIDSAPGRANLLAAMRHSRDPRKEALLALALRDPDPAVRLAATRWIADERLSDYRPRIEAAMNDPVITPRLLAAYMAALERFEGRGDYVGKPGPSIGQYLAPKITDPAATAEVRRLALKALPADDPQLPLPRAGELLSDPDPEVRLEVVRWLASGTRPDRLPLLMRTAQDPAQLGELRTNAITGLSAEPQKHAELLRRLTADPDPVVRAEALRALGEGRAIEPGRPPLTDTDAWLNRLEGPADAAAGRRLFFHPVIAQCHRCHAAEGRGGHVGPDLTAIHRRADRRRVLESILRPSQEIAPQFHTWIVTTRDGKTLTGYLTRGTGDRHWYIDATGKPFDLPVSEIASRRSLPVSIMPPDLANLLTDQELRDLMAYLTDPLR